MIRAIAALFLSAVALVQAQGPVRIQTGANLPGGSVGVPYSTTLMGRGGSPPYLWSFAGGDVPPGLRMDARAGEISGTPSQAGTFRFTVGISDSMGGSDSRAVMIVIASTAPAPPPALVLLTSGALAGATVGTGYSASFSAAGGQTPYAWSISGGNAPPGLTMDSAGGVLSGTPTTAGTYGFQIRVTDANATAATSSVSIAVLAPLSVGTGSLPPGIVTQAYTASLGATGGVSPYSWSISAGTLPNGLAMDGAGQISGTPTARGNFGFTAQVSDSAGKTASRALSINVTAPVLTMAAGSLPAGTVGVAYSAGVSASGGVPPMRFAVSAGSLPQGLTLDANTGQIGGSPSTAGSYSLTVQVTDSAAQTVAQSYVLAVSPGVSITSGDPPNGTVGVPYSASLAATGGTPPYTWSVIGGSLPAGIGLSAAGQLSGTPTASGTSRFTVRSTDSTGSFANQPLSITIVAGVTVSSGGLGSGVVGIAYSGSLSASGGTPPYTWSITQGALPGGLSLNSTTGQITGTPTTAGTFSFTAQARDVSGSIASGAFSISVAAGVSITTGSLAGGVVGVAYSATLAAVGGTGSYTWSVGGGALPPGVSLDAATGQITGTPTAAGTYAFTAQVRDSSGGTASKPLSIAVSSALSVTSSGSFSSGVVGTPYSASLSATGGTGPYTWTIAGGSLPGGVSLDAATGQIAGTPTAAGTFAFSVQARDANGATASASLSITIAAQLSITTGSLGNAVVGVAYSASLSASGGTGSYTWSIGGGSLPPSVALDATTGQITGTPTAAGTYALTAQVRDSSGATASKQLSIAVSSALSVTSSGSLSSGVVGTSYSASLSAAGGTGPYTWSVAGGSLPGGLSLDAATGQITGTPTAAGTFAFSVQVRDANGATASGSLSISIAVPLSINTGSLGNGVVGVAYSASLSAAGGTGSYAWSLGGGSLPPGVSLDAATGQITGTPTAAGTFGFTVQVRDASGATASKPFSIAISAALSVTSSGSLSAGVVGTSYSATLSAAGGTGPYTWSVTGGSLPAGLTLDTATGQISGTPTAAGSAAFTVQVRDANGATASAAVSITVTAALTVSGATLANGVVGTAYSASLSAAGGTGPYTWSVTNGSLPGGLSLASGGQISGTPNAAGTFAFTAQARDANGATASGQFSITVGASLTVTSGSAGNGVVGAAYSASLGAAGGTGPYTWSISGGALPDGLTLSSGGQITGTPTTAGTFGFTVQARDANGATATKQLSITVVPQLSITGSSLPNAVVGSPYSANLGAAGGTTPYSWSIQSGSLPAGLAINGAGQIAGTPSAAGSFSFTVRVTDASNQTADAPLTLTVGASLAVTGCPAAALTVGQAYSATLSAAGGTAPYRWDVSAGQLPAGLTLSAGQITGTPTTAGSGDVTFRVTDATSATATRACPLTVVDALTISSSQLAAGSVGQAYSQTLNANGGTPPYSWTVSGGSVPPGLSVNSGGQITGTPTTAGQYTFTVRAADSKGLAAEKTVSIAIQSGVVINGCPAAGATVGQPYSSTVTANGGTPPYRWTISGGALPGGLSINGTSGAITGTPAAAGPFQFTLAVNDSATGAASQSCTIAVRAPLSIGGTLPATGVGATYQGSLSASGGTAPYSWSVVGGSLPTGLSLASNGQVTGVATAPGQFTFTVRVTDSTGAATDQQFTVAVAVGLTVAACPASTGTVGAAYSSLLAANGGRPPLTWSIETGQIPTGVALSAGGALTGVPIAAGNFPFTLRVLDAAGTVATRACTVAINPPLSIVTGRLADAAVRVRYNETLTATGGLPPYTWTLVGGALPPGLLLNANGVVSGAPVELGRYSFTIGVTDSAGNYKETSFSINVNAGLTVPECPQVTAVVGRRYSSVLSAIGGQSPYTWTVLGGSIPPGLSLAPATGAITGVPSQPGGFGFTAQATDAAGTSATRLCNVDVFPELRITTTTAPDAVVGSSYAADLQVTGGGPPYTWAVSSGALPAGITLSAATGRLTGQPSQEGSARFTVTVTDALGGTADRELTITVRTAFAVAACPSPGATAGQPYFATLSAVGGQSPYRWSITSGALPAGLTLTGSTVEGTPAAAGSAEFTLSATDAGSATSTRACAIQVSAPALSILSPAALPGTQVASAYSVTLEATGGRGPYQWSVIDGALPEGMTLGPDGVLTGKPNQAGVFPVTLRVVDQDGVAVEETFRVEVRPLDPPRLTISGLPATTRAAQQPILRISLVEPHPVPVRGTVTLGFTPESDMPVDDPAIQFSSGGRLVDFIIPANEMEAQVPGSLLAIQTGTVAGRIHVSAVAQSEGGAEGAVLAETDAQVQRTPPRITNARAVRNANGLAIQITGYTTARTITLGKFRFTGRAGSNIPSAEIPVDMTAAAQAWFASDASARFGSQFLLNQPFQIQGDVSAIESVTVTLSNADGDSNEVTTALTTP